jgi:hypothetical protein
MKMKWLRPDVISCLFVIVGAALLILTLKYRVNPVEGSVVDPAVRGGALHWILLFTTMPAWIAGATLGLTVFGDVAAIEIAFMFLIQTALYYFLGKIVSLAVAVIRKGLLKSDKTP